MIVRRRFALTTVTTAGSARIGNVNVTRIGKDLTVASVNAIKSVSMVDLALMELVTVRPDSKENIASRKLVLMTALVMESVRTTPASAKRISLVLTAQ